MYVTEAMIQSMEHMMRNAADMEKSIKAMMETEGRMHGLELDRRHSARDMWKQLMEHMASASAQSSMMCEVDMHTHDDGMPHTHAEEDMDGLPSDVEPPMDTNVGISSAPPANVGISSEPPANS